jgi:integrase
MLCASCMLPVEQGGCHMPNFSKAFIDTLEPKSADYFEWDTSKPGFGVRVWPSGKKTYLLQYRADGKTRRFSCGVHGAVTLEEARKKATVQQGKIATGADPSAERKARREAKTVAELCEEYLGAADKGLIIGKGGRPKKASTIAEDRSRIRSHVLPLLGARRVIDLKRADVNRFMNAIASGKTARTGQSSKLRGTVQISGGAGIASRVIGMLGGILSYAVDQDIIESNPVYRIKKPADGKRERRLDDTEFARLGAALLVGREECWTPQGLNAIWLLALTGFRKEEIMKLQWSEVDIGTRCFRLGDSKTGQSVRPLSRAAMEVIDGIERQPGNPFVLVGVKGAQSYRGLEKALAKALAHAEIEDVSAHTFRHSFASNASELGFVDATIGAMIGHKSGTVTSRYVHVLDSVLIAAADKTAAHIERLMTGKTGEIVQLPRAKSV